MVQLRTIRRLTIIASIAHLVQAIVVFSLTFNTNTKVSLVQNYVKWPKNETMPLMLASDPGGSIHLKYLVFAFFLLSFVFQGTPAVFQTTWRYFYEILLCQKGIQPLRWIEYCASASCLFMTCAVVNGVTDLHFLLLLFFANATIMLLGWVQEVWAYMYNACSYIEVKITRNVFEFLMPHILGWLLYIPMWVFMMTKFIISVSHSDQSPPSFVYALMLCNVFVFSSFGMVQAIEMVMIYRKPHKTKEYALNAELAYTILSLTAKSFTAWFFYGGVVASSVFAKQ